MSTPIEASDSVCVVCFKGIEIYSVGECDHPVCFECSTRMRVLCLQTECPICRQDLAKVIFSHSREPFKKLNTQPFKNLLFERKAKICFVDEEIKDAYHRMLEHRCRKCGDSAQPFNTLVLLKEHLRRDHELFFCDLCVENLKIFTNERKFYTKQQLAHHRRKGDIDDTSHKGHPLCEFCDQRYMDTDELFRHLRKDHLYCHLCDADGYHQFYGSYRALRDHFRKDHYVCEEEECGEQKLTGVFRTEIDLKAHKAMEHGKGLSKQAARQARTLEVQFTLTPRQSRTHQQPPQHHRVEQESVMEAPYEEPPPLMVSAPSIDTLSTTQFPTLGGEGGGGAALLVGGAAPGHLRQSVGALLRTQQNFPSLSAAEPALPGPPGPHFRVNITHQAPGPSSAVIRTSAKPNVSIQVHKRPQSAANPFRITETSNKQLSMKLADRQQQMETRSKFMEEFPSLSKKDRNLLLDNHYTSFTPPATSTIAKKISTPAPAQPVAAAPAVLRAPPPPTLEAFPALSAGPAPAAPAPAQWITPRPKEPAQPPKATKVAPAPQVNEFPILKSKKNAKKIEKSPSIPNIRQETTTNISNNNNNNISKKDKKKGKADSNSERPPESTPPDFMTKNKHNDKENNSLYAHEGSKKKNIAPAPSFETKDTKNANLKNGHIQEKPKYDKEKEPKSKQDNNKNAAKKSPPAVSLEEEFPSLSIVKKPPNFKMAKTDSKPPPGFARPAPAPAPATTPPGFTNSHHAVPPCNGFTFTSSSGQHYKIHAHNYVQPADFNDRNGFLVATFMEVLNSPESFSEFKQLSQMFREGTYSSESYYNHCIKSLGENFDKVFPELLALLPDISKQQELHREHMARQCDSLEVCSVCGQVMTEQDVACHQSFHSMQSNFPALGASH